MTARHKDQLLHGAEAVWQPDEMGRASVALARMGPMLEEADGPFGYRFASEEQASNPEELFAAAHVTCYASSLTSVLLNRGLVIGRVTLRSVCVVRPEPEQGVGIGWRIALVVLEVVVEGALTETELEEARQVADRICPISKAIGGPVAVRWRGTLAGG